MLKRFQLKKTALVCGTDPQEESRGKRIISEKFFALRHNKNFIFKKSFYDVEAIPLIFDA